MPPLSPHLHQPQATGNERGLLGGIKVKNVVTGEVTSLDVSGLFFAIGHKPATDFLEGQVGGGGCLWDARVCAVFVCGGGGRGRTWARGGPEIAGETHGS